MTEKRNKGKSITDLVEKRRDATQRILDSMPAIVDEIKAEREREVWKRRKAIREREKSEMVCDSPVVGPQQSASNSSKG